MVLVSTTRQEPNQLQHKQQQTTTSCPHTHQPAFRLCEHTQVWTFPTPHINSHVRANVRCPSLYFTGIYKPPVKNIAKCKSIKCACMERCPETTFTSSSAVVCAACVCAVARSRASLCEWYCTSSRTSSSTNHVVQQQQKCGGPSRKEISAETCRCHHAELI